MKNNALTLIIVIAILLRLIVGIYHQFWFDEAFSFFIAKQSLPNLIQAIASDTTPPLFFLILHAFQSIGKSEFILRLPSLIFGTLSFPLIFLIGKKFHSKKLGLIAAAILAFSPLHIYYSQETRMYSQAIFLNLISFHFFMILFKSDFKKGKIGFALSLLLGLYTHYYFLISWLTFNFLSFIYFKLNRQTLISWIKFQLAILAIYLPWILTFISLQHPKPWKYPLLQAIPATFIAFAMDGLGPKNLKILLIDSPFLYIKVISLTLATVMFMLFLSSILIAINKPKTSQKTKRATALSVLLVIVPILIASTISIFTPIYSLRSLVIFSPFYFLAISLAIINIKNQRIAVSSILTIVLLSLLLVSTRITSPYIWENPTKKASLHLLANYQPGDIIAHTSLYTYYPFRYYHDDKLAEYLIIESGLSDKTTAILNQRSRPIEELIQPDKRIWIIDMSFLAPSLKPETDKFLKSLKLKEISSERLNNIIIYLYKT